MKNFKKGQQSGFTLIEIAIVLVIIGLLLGGVLKGQEMIENSRIKAVVADMRGVSAAYNSYVDRFHAIPGDETSAVMLARGWTSAVGGNGNNVLAITNAQTFTNGGEQRAFWSSLRFAGFTTGNALATGVAGLPKAGNNGLLGVTIAPYGMPGVAACVSNLSTKQARGVDTTIDGAEQSNLGDARGNATAAVNPLAPGAAAVTVPYDESTTLSNWTMCRPL